MCDVTYPAHPPLAIVNLWAAAAGDRTQSSKTLCRRELQV